MNNQPLLSICIQSCNRANLLWKVLNSITSQKAFIRTDDVEIVLFIDDSSEAVCREFTDKYHGKIKYFTGVFEEKDFLSRAQEKCSGRFVKLGSDTVYMLDNSLKRMINDIKTADGLNSDGVFFADKTALTAGAETKFGDFLRNVRYDCTKIYSFCFKKMFLEKYAHNSDYNDTVLQLLDLTGKLYLQNSAFYVSDNQYQKELFILNENYNKYSFNSNYFKILKKYKKQGLLNISFLKMLKLRFKLWRRHGNIRNIQNNNEDEIIRNIQKPLEFSGRPILSICIPAYNRADLLNQTLESITSQKIFQDTDYIEIFISNNASTDNTDEVIKKYTQKFPDKIRSVRHEKQIYSDENILFALLQGKGQFVKFNNDTCKFRENSLEGIIDDIKTADECGADGVFFANEGAHETALAENFDDFIKNAGYISTWIGAHCYRKSFINSLDDIGRCCHLQLNQVDLAGRFFERKRIMYISNAPYFITIPAPGRGGYNIAEVFGHNYLSILYGYSKKGLLTKKTIEKSKPELLKFININYFDLKKEFSYRKTGYFKYLFKYFWQHLYFYKWYFHFIFKSFSLNTAP